MRLGETAPDFSAETTQGRISFHDWIGDAWCVFFSHPKDFTPVCTTEIGAFAKAGQDFAQRGIKIIGLSVDPVEQHLAWLADVEETQGVSPNFPIVGDTDLSVAKLYGMLAAESGDTSDGRTAADNQTVRSVFVINPEKKVVLTLAYPMTTGRNVAELLRVIDSLQLTYRHKVATPANWRSGEDVIIVPALSDDEARQRFPAGWRAPKPYMRITAQPM